jgi:hypothetical protein
MGWMTEALFPAYIGFFLYYIQINPETHAANNSKTSFSSPKSKAEVKKASSFTSAVTVRFHVVMLRYKNDFIFTFK